MTDETKPDADRWERIPTVQELRDTEVPWPKTQEELTAFIASLVKRQHDYNSQCYAVSMAAVAAFYYAAGTLGLSLNQAGHAVMDVVRRTRVMKGPFMIVDISNALYPQYDLVKLVRDGINESREWLRDEARKLLASTHADDAHTDVIAHWRELAEEASEVLP